MTEFAISKAGHDKGQIYCIIERCENSVFLANGTTKSIEHPKKKREKHIQVIRHLPEEIVAQCLNSQGVYCDLGIKRALKLYLAQEKEAVSTKR